MIANIRVYDEDVDELSASIDEAARSFDAAKYGLPPEVDKSRFRHIIYVWLSRKNRKEQERKDEV